MNGYQKKDRSGTGISGFTTWPEILGILILRKFQGCNPSLNFQLQTYNMSFIQGLVVWLSYPITKSLLNSVTQACWVKMKQRCEQHQKETVFLEGCVLGTVQSFAKKLGMSEHEEILKGTDESKAPKTLQNWPIINPFFVAKCKVTITWQFCDPDLFGMVNVHDSFKLLSHKESPGI